VTGGTDSSEDHTPKVPTTGWVINPNTKVGISQYNDKFHESCMNVCTVYQNKATTNMKMSKSY